MFVLFWTTMMNCVRLMDMVSGIPRMSWLHGTRGQNLIFLDWKFNLEIRTFQQQSRISKFFTQNATKRFKNLLFFDNHLFLKAKRHTKSPECWNMQDNTAYKGVSSDEPVFAQFRNLDDAIKECDRLGESKCGTINYSNACCGANRGWYQLRPQLQATNTGWTGYRVYTRSENYDSC